ncbi:MAG: alpha/beta hydrolase, partial [Lachnospiraceae bacterium]|nr:alpha/beta hydrolase [Lachnospiraceae bacterium]
MPRVRNPKKLAVIIPGIGYGNDRPLLYYSARILKNSGFDLLKVEFYDMPTDISEDDELKKLAVQLACEQTESSLAGVDFAAYQDI